MLLLAIFDAKFRARFVKGDLICVHSDTQAEYPETYSFIEESRELCKAWDIPFFHLTADKGYHSPKWSSGLIRQMERLGIVFSRNMKSCSHGLKIAPIYNFADEFIGQRYGFPYGRKRGLYNYTKAYGRLNVWIGYTAGEERRAARAEGVEQTAFGFVKKPKKRHDKWMDECVERVYPLIELGWDRERCQQYIRECGVTSLPYPSLCRFCPHSSPELILRLAMTAPDDFALWQRLEDEKIRRNAGRFDDKGIPIANHGVHPGVRLSDTVAMTREKYRHLNDAQLRSFLDNFRMNHGHCGTAF